MSDYEDSPIWRDGFTRGYNHHRALIDADVEIERLLAENKQLRQFQESLHPTELKDYTKTYYVINNKQIDSAVQCINEFALTSQVDWCWIALGELDIYQNKDGWVMR